MSRNLYREKLEDQLLRDVQSLKQFVREIRGNQTRMLVFGGITLDGEEGEIRIENDGNELKLDQSGFTITKDPDSSAYLNIFSLLHGVENLGNLEFSRQPDGSQTEIRQRVRESSATNQISYNTLQIDNIGGTRLAFLQFSYERAASVFAGAGLQFGLNGVFAAFQVQVVDSLGNGWMRIPRSNGNPSTLTPSGADIARMSYDTAVDRFKFREGTNWRTLGNQQLTGLTLDLSFTTPYGRMDVTFVNGVAVSYVYI